MRGLLFSLLMGFPLAAAAGQAAKPGFDQISNGAARMLYNLDPEEMKDPQKREAAINKMLEMNGLGPKALFEPQGDSSLEVQQWRIVTLASGEGGNVAADRTPKPPGTQVMGEAVLSEDVKQADFALLDKTGTLIFNLQPTAKPSGAPDRNFYFLFPMPSESFALKVSGTDAQDKSFVRYPKNFIIPKVE